MARKSGRPPKNEIGHDSQQKIIDAAVKLIKEIGADNITVRKVCTEAESSIGTFYHYFRDKDELLMYFIQELPFKNCELKENLSNISERIIELYMKLVNRYMELGLDFMKCFYTSSNSSLKAYMSEIDGKFLDGTVMSRCEEELSKAQDEGYVKKDLDPHVITADVCCIVKGCIFDWCLTDGKSELKENIRRILNAYFLYCICL